MKVIVPSYRFVPVTASDSATVSLSDPAILWRLQTSFTTRSHCPRVVEVCCDQRRCDDGGCAPRGGCAVRAIQSLVMQCLVASASNAITAITFSDWIDSGLWLQQHVNVFHHHDNYYYTDTVPVSLQ